MIVIPKTRPSYSQGFARYAGESKYPGLRRGMIHATCPALGPTGSKLFDQSPYKNHGTLTGMDPATDWVVGQMGYHLDYDATNDYVDCGDVDIFSMTDGAGNDKPFSISAWIRLTEFTLAHSIISKWDNIGATNYEWYFLYSGSAINFNMYHQDATAYIGRSAPFVSGTYLNQWAHVVGTYNGNEALSGIDVYINGVVSDDTNISAGVYTGMTKKTSPVRIGAAFFAGLIYLPWQGQLGPIYIYNRVLSRPEITLLRTNPFAPFELKEDVYGMAVAAAAGGVIYPQLERGLRGVERGVYSGAI